MSAIASALRPIPVPKPNVLRSDPVAQAFTLMRVAFTVAPIAFGLDKFVGVLTDDWTRYLSNRVQRPDPGDRGHRDAPGRRRRDRGRAGGGAGAALRRPARGRLAAAVIIVDLLLRRRLRHIAGATSACCSGPVRGAAAACGPRDRLGYPPSTRREQRAEHLADLLPADPHQEAVVPPVGLAPEDEEARLRVRQGVGAVGVWARQSPPAGAEERRRELHRAAGGVALVHLELAVERCVADGAGEREDAVDRHLLGAVAVAQGDLRTGRPAARSPRRRRRAGALDGGRGAARRARAASAASARALGQRVVRRRCPSRARGVAQRPDHARARRSRASAARSRAAVCAEWPAPASRIVRAGPVSASAREVGDAARDPLRRARARPAPGCRRRRGCSGVP